MADPVTPDDILSAAAQIAAEGIASAQGDQGSITALDPLKMIETADKVAARGALAGKNPRGGLKSGFRRIATGRAGLPRAE